MGLALPPIPEHPRFRMHESKEQFLFHKPGYDSRWQFIELLVESKNYAVEDICNCAIVAFLEITQYGPPGNIDAHENLEAWRKFKQEMCK